ncbi:alkylhydroperoxidase ahpd core [Lucifera butyrica]|uniref:Alkylhydroperoxidase ahpd core n=1 Tax=Lucifera butyrica TaxID=1351585 RepID=A0A498R8D7_9FIRM|nr:carboxymuconolactone decarboxylase family protein [Lucifera butyrica]VBB06443.1 alkylhydroperoxidase ahpd core [Lucifera butyrica]
MSLDNRMTELIAIGVSVGANCQPCLEYHVAKAREIGISEQEIQEAIHVGQTVRKGAAYKMDQHIMALREKPSAGPQPAGGGCACGCGDSC